MDQPLQPRVREAYDIFLPIARAVEALPWVSRATVTRRLPGVVAVSVARHCSLLPPRCCLRACCYVGGAWRIRSASLQAVSIDNLVNNNLASSATKSHAH